ncbi:MAG: ABC transporter ATP-binding protein [Nannocystaceae bacterium]|nr:ABC transporter ATP-binding protein [Nannocystaceae bacterium]
MSEQLGDDDEYSGQLNWALWKRMLAHAAPYQRELAGMAAMGLGVAAIDTAIPVIMGTLIDETITSGLTLRLWAYVAVYGGLIGALGLAIFGFIWLAGLIATGVAHDLRRAGFARLQTLSFSYFDTRPVGWLVARLTSDVSKISGLLPWLLLDFVWGTAVLFGAAAVMLWIDATLALYVLSIVPPLVFASVLFQRRLLDSSRRVRKTNSRMTAAFNEAITGVRTTKSLAREADNLEEFQHESGDMFRYSMRRALQSAIYLPLVISLGSVGVGVALWQGGMTLGDGISVGGISVGGISVGTLVAFMKYAALFSMPIQELARRFTDLQSAQASAERVQSLLETDPEISDSEAVQAAIARQDGASPATDIAIDGGDATIRDLTFDEVGFFYKEGQPVLSEVSFSVRAGQTVALVGPTGGGKSTIVSLLARFYEAKSGAVRVNGVDIRERSLSWLQGNLGVVLQTPHLFSGTLADNIRYGRLDASDEEIRDAARTVHAHDFIQTLPDRYDTQVGEGGAKLSTGQRQLVSLARAVLADPQIFIMDEATSSVDTETEARVQAGIDAILRGRTAFVIAHRLSTIRNADLILVVEGGRIVERGTHDTLLTAGGRYAALAARNRANAPHQAALA